jgi:archaeal type IV pilus assembly protein PilA
MNESAVSESIGVIVLVAITMVLAAAIAAYMFSLTSTIPKNYNVLVTVEKPNATSVSVMYQGGLDSALLNSMTITWPDGTQEFIPYPTVGKIYGPAYLTPDNRHIIVVGNFTTSHTEQVILNTFL